MMKSQFVLVFRLLIYEYDIQTVDHIHNPTEPEENGIKIETKAKYYFELLNHDQNGCILARYQVIKIAGNK